jgi:tight adherence protein C
MQLVISFLITIMFFLAFIFFSLTERKTKLRKRIENYVGAEKVSDKGKDEKIKLRFKDKILQFRNKTRGMKDKAGELINKKISSQKEEKLERKLLQLGNPWGITSADFQFYIFIFQIAIPLIFGIYASLLKAGLGSVVLLVIIGIMISIFVPDYYIDGKIRKRYKQALLELPDFLDLLTVSLEAGLGFDLALNKVISRRSGVLSSEFHICLEEIRLGKTRKEALTGVKERLSFDELKALINSILQAEKLGISFVQIFRVKSHEEREKRRQRAEEQAMKAPVKILFPLVMFIFPSIFIVILGPIAIQLVQVFSE